MQIGFPSTSLAVPGALGPFPAARLYADNLAYPTTTDVIAWIALDDGALGDKLKGVPSAGGAVAPGGLLAAGQMLHHGVADYRPAWTALNLADGAAGNNWPGASQMDYNGATFDRARNNTAGTLLTLAARTITTSSTTQVNYSKRGLYMFLFVSAKAAATTLTVKAQLIDPVSANGFDAMSIAAVPANAGAGYLFLLTPGAVAADVPNAVSWFRAGMLARPWVCTIVPSDADSVTYSVGYALA